MNLSMKDAIRRARAAGADVSPKRGTGELVFCHPRITRPVVVSNSRKDTLRKVVSFLRQCEKA